jgi:hypothetical protein
MFAAIEMTALLSAGLLGDILQLDGSSLVVILRVW